MTRPIVVGVALREDDAAPLALAGALARLVDAPLALVTSYPRETRSALVSPDYAIALRQETRRQLEAVAERLGDQHEVTAFVRQGSAAQALHDVAEHYDAAAIVVGSTHRGQVGRVLAGDVAANLLHGAPCPVAVAPRGYTAPVDGLRRIGVAFTDTPEGRHALTGAAALAEVCGATVQCLTVAEPLGSMAAGAVPGWAPAYDLIDSARQRAQETAAAALAAGPAGVETTSEVLDGPIVAALAGASAPLDLLVAGSRGYGALRSVIAGSVSRGLAHSVECPLLVVPRGPAYESPLVGGEPVGAAASPR